MKNWTSTQLGNDADQYLVYREDTGRTVAVTHDDPGGQNATAIAALPELLEALEMAQAALRHAAQECEGRVKKEIVGGWLFHANQARDAINKSSSY